MTPVEIQNISRRFGKVQALDDVSLTVAHGKVTAILGPNGAGKTTLINILLGLVKPSRGKVSVFGMAPGRMSVRKKVGAMFQDTELPELLTVSEHIALFSSYYDTPRPIEESLSLAGLTDLKNRVYRKLSGGQKRRVQFATAIAGNPELLFLDEPTTGLDLEARRSLWQVVKQLTSDGVSIILTTHYLEEADSLADNITVINEGTIVADGPAEEIRRKVGGKKIRARTSVDEMNIATRPEIRSVIRTGHFLDILTTDEIVTARWLLQNDSEITDLTIKGTGLEDAFTALTGKTDASASEVSELS